MELTARERTVVENIWGKGTSADHGDINSDELIQMHHRVTDAVQLSFEDSDIDSLCILLPLEVKITQTLFARI